MAISAKELAKIEHLLAGCDPEQRRIAEPLLHAQVGDKTALPAVRKVFDVLPEFIDFWGDLAKRAVDALLELKFGENLASQEAVRKKMAELRADLMGDRPSLLEGLLVERVVVCWLHVHYADGYYVQKQNGGTFRENDYAQRHQDRAQRRYLAAIKALATVRRLQLPITLAVNVATVEAKTAKPACLPVAVGASNVGELKDPGTGRRGIALASRRAFEP